MSAEERGHSQHADAVRRVTRPKWRYLYFLLAAFDLVTVSAGLYLNHRIMSIYRSSVDANRVWAVRVSAYSHLGELAGDVDAPGNDVFDTRDVQKEFIRMNAAVQAFDADLLKQRQELQAHLDHGAAAPLLTLLDAIAVAKTQMTEEAARIFDYFMEGRPDLAGERMATMDHKYASLNAALLELRRAVGAIQQENFTKQTAAAAELQRYEYGIGLSIVFMVLGATYYGHKVAQQMQSDANERERHFNALSEAEARTRTILDTAADGIVSFDRQGRVESFNKAAERLFGLDAGQAVGQDIRAMIPEMAAHMDAKASGNAADALTIIPSAIGGEQLGLRHDGTTFPLELSVSNMDLERTRTFTAIVRDIGDRRRAEEAIAVAAAAQAANRAKSQFLANMSHEIRTPMSGVLGMAEMLLDTNLTPTQRRFAESVHRSGESLLKIIDGILDFSKIEAGKIDLESVDFKPREMTEEVAHLLREAAEKKGLQLVCRVSEEVPDVLSGAQSRLRQVLINLVGNAIKFTDRGGVTIRVSTLDVRSDDPMTSAVSGVAPAGTAGTVLHFSVLDTGIGIAASVQNRLFRAFEQADSSTTRSYGGTGLGLAISRELVEKMGGRIGVRSTLGHGAEFWFTVRLDPPLVRPLAPAPGTRATRDGHSFSGVRVLLAEDNPINQDVAVTMLETLGCRVHVVDTGVKTLAALEEGEFDIVLMDRQMPEMDGFDTTAEIRARGLLRPNQPPGAGEPVRLPIVGLTASALKGDREMCIAAGMDDYLAKPFRRAALRSVLERWVLDQMAGPGTKIKISADQAPPETFDRGVLDRMCVNQTSGSPRIVAALIDHYRADAARLIDALEQGGQQSDTAAVAHAAHLLSVGSEFVGARKLAHMCGELERTALAEETPALDQRIAGVRQEYDDVRQAMEAVRSNG